MEQFKTTSFDWEEKTRKNAQTIEKLIRQMEENFKLDTVSSSPEELAGFMGGGFHEFWPFARRISDAFRNTTPLKSDEREKLWERFQASCQLVRELQEEYQEELDVNSRNNLADIKAKVDKAVEITKGASTHDQFNRAMDILNEAMQVLKTKPMTREDRDTAWESWRSANDGVKIQREEVKRNNFKTMEHRIKRGWKESDSGDPYEAKNILRECSSELRELFLDREQRDRLRSEIDTAWNVAVGKIEFLRGERENARKDWRGRLESSIERKLEFIERKKAYYTSLEGQIEQLQFDIDTSWSPSYKSKAERWVAEKRVKQEELKSQIAETEKEIEELKIKLNELPEDTSDSSASEGSKDENL